MGKEGHVGNKFTIRSIVNRGQNLTKSIYLERYPCFCYHILPPCPLLKSFRLEHNSQYNPQGAPLQSQKAQSSAVRGKRHYHTQEHEKNIPELLKPTPGFSFLQDALGGLPRRKERHSLATAADRGAHDQATVRDPAHTPARGPFSGPS